MAELSYCYSTVYENYGASGDGYYLVGYFWRMSFLDFYVTVPLKTP